MSGDYPLGMSIAGTLLGIVAGSVYAAATAAAEAIRMPSDQSSYQNGQCEALRLDHGAG